VAGWLKLSSSSFPPRETPSLLASTHMLFPLAPPVCCAHFHFGFVQSPGSFPYPPQPAPPSSGGLPGLISAHPACGCAKSRHARATRVRLPAPFLSHLTVSANNPINLLQTLSAASPQCHPHLALHRPMQTKAHGNGPSRSLSCLDGISWEEVFSLGWAKRHFFQVGAKHTSSSNQCPGLLLAS